MDDDEQVEVANRIIRELNDALPDGALLGENGYDDFAPPLDVGSDSQSVILSGNMVTLEEAAIRRRVTSIMRQIGANVRTGALGNLFMQAVATIGLGDWETLTLNTRKVILKYIEGGIRIDSSFWTRAGHMVGGGRETRQEQIDRHMNEWGHSSGIAPLLYGRDFEEAGDRPRAHLESRYQSVTEFDENEYVDSLLDADPEVGKMMDDEVADAVEGLSGRRAAAMPQVIQSEGLRPVSSTHTNWLAGTGCLLRRRTRSASFSRVESKSGGRRVLVTPTAVMTSRMVSTICQVIVASSTALRGITMVGPEGAPPPRPDPCTHH